MMSRLRPLPRRIALLSVSLMFAAVASAAELPPAWQCLPEQTLVLLRAEEPGRRIDQLRETTRFGQVMLTPERWEKLWTAIKDAEPDDIGGFESTLAKVGLAPADLPPMLRGTLGYAVTIEPAEEGEEPLIVGLAWLNPGAELAGKLIEAVQRGVELAQDDPHPIRRIDMQIADRDVMLLKVPEVAGGPEDFGLTGIDELEGEIPEREDGAAEPAEPRQVAQSNVFITRLGGRVLVAHSFPREPVETDDPADVDFDARSGLEAATGVFARFLQAHDAGGAHYGTRLLSTPGMRAALPAGLPLFELYGDLRPLIDAMRRGAGLQEFAEAAAALETFGLNKLSTGGFRLSLDGDAMRNGFFLAAPAPRTGLLALLDQDSLPAEPALWAPSDATDYSHFSFDLGEAYRRVRDLVIEQFGAESERFFQEVDMNVRAAVGADLDAVLGGLGARHMFVSFPPRVPEAFDPENPTALTERVGMVWRLRDEQLWQRVMQTLGGFVMMGGGQWVEPADEQGFTGYRSTVPQAPAALMIGRGYLTLTLGRDVTARLLNALVNPPEGEAAMIRSALFSRMSEKLSIPAGTGYRLGDLGRYLQAVARIGQAGLEHARREADANPEARSMIERVGEFLPDPRTVREMFGGGTGVMYTDEYGLTSRGLLELPPAE
jgi:hypothetical protein